MVTKEDNLKLPTPPTSDSVYKTLSRANLHTAPGTEGLPRTDVMVEVFKEKPLTTSQRNSLMVFGAKPKKLSSILPRDNRKYPF